MRHLEGFGEVGDIDRVEVTASFGHACHRLRPLGPFTDEQASVLGHLRVETLRHLEGLSTPEGELLPAVADKPLFHLVGRHHGEVAAQGIEHRFLDFG